MPKQDILQPPVLIITGPTASGKTALSELLIQKMPSEVINADVGQFYVPLSIGTAKPDLSTLTYPTYGFDVLNEPRDLSVVAYRAMVVDWVDQIRQRKRMPMLVGGSLFYIKSLFFPPFEFTNLKSGEVKEGTALSIIGPSLWQQLHAIDPDRARELHPNDEYRLRRALAIWHKTGVKPSLYKPVFQPPFRAVIVFVNPDRDLLNKKIKQRVEIMMRQGWLDEASRLVGTPWEPFLHKKGLIGYPELIEWIKQGRSRETFDAVIKKIQNETVAYAKRQVTFWKSFTKQLEQAGACSSGWCSVVEVPGGDEASMTMLERVLELFQNNKNR